MIKRFILAVSFVALATATFSRIAYAETATQACWNIIVEAKDNMQNKAARDFKECVERFELSDPASKTSKQLVKERKKSERQAEKERKKAEKERLKEEVKTTKLLSKQEKKALREKKKEERVKLKAQIKTEKARIKAEKKAAKEAGKEYKVEQSAVCAADPESELCKSKKSLKDLFKKLKDLGGKNIGEPG